MWAACLLSPTALGTPPCGQQQLLSQDTKKLLTQVCPLTLTALCWCMVTRSADDNIEPQEEDGTSFAPGCTARKWMSRDSNPGGQTPGPQLSPPNYQGPSQHADVSFQVPRNAVCEDTEQGWRCSHLHHPIMVMSHRWLLSSRNVPSATEGPNFK